MMHPGRDLAAIPQCGTGHTAASACPTDSVCTMEKRSGAWHQNTVPTHQRFPEVLRTWQMSAPYGPEYTGDRLERLDWNEIISQSVGCSGTYIKLYQSGKRKKIISGNDGASRRVGLFL